MLLGETPFDETDDNGTVAAGMVAGETDDDGTVVAGTTPGETVDTETPDFPA